MGAAPSALPYNLRVRVDVRVAVHDVRFNVREAVHDLMFFPTAEELVTMQDPAHAQIVVKSCGNTKEKPRKPQKRNKNPLVRKPQLEIKPHFVENVARHHVANRNLRFQHSIPYRHSFKLHWTVCRKCNKSP